MVTIRQKPKVGRPAGISCLVSHSLPYVFLSAGTWISLLGLLNLNEFFVTVDQVQYANKRTSCLCNEHRVAAGF